MSATALVADRPSVPAGEPAAPIPGNATAAAGNTGGLRCVDLCVLADQLGIDGVTCGELASTEMMSLLGAIAVSTERTRLETSVGAVVCVQAKDMKEPWCLATSLADENARLLLKKYAKRWSIECSFRDSKDPHFGMGMGQIRISSPERGRWERSSSD